MSEPDWEDISRDSALRFRAASMAACLGWECHCPPGVVSMLLERTIGWCPLSAYQHWSMDLYREGPTSYSEGRAVQEHLLHLVRNMKQARRIRHALVAQLPEKRQEMARSHPLMLGWKPIRLLEEDSALRRNLYKIGIGRNIEVRDHLPPIDREAAFDRFLEFHGFRDAFQRYWHKPPKHRDNLRTRVLVIVSAVVASTVELQTNEQCEHLLRRLKAECHVSAQTAADILEIARRLHVELLPVAELGERLIADATEADRNNFGALMRIIAENPAVSEGKRERAAALSRQLEPFLRPG